MVAHSATIVALCATMVFLRKTIISLWDIMVGSSGSNNCWISRREISPWLRIAQQLLRYAQPWFSKGKQLSLTKTVGQVRREIMIAVVLRSKTKEAQ